MFTQSLPAFLLYAGSGLLVSAGASAGETRISKIDINFAQTYGLTPCPSTAPAADSCLNVTGVSDQRDIGHMTFSRVVLFNPSLFDGSHPTCIPDETSGTLTLPRGTLKFHAPGSVCFSEGIAVYDIVITGGTDAYEGAIGRGQIIVPPPETGSTGRELWHLELFTNEHNDFRFY